MANPSEAQILEQSATAADKKNAANRKHGGDPHKLPDDAALSLKSAEFPSQQSAAIKARWLVEKNSEIDLKRIFSSIDYQEGLDLLARMRKNCEISGHTLNERISHDDESAKCHVCGGGRKQGRQWYLLRPFIHPVTRIIQNRYFCDISCVVRENHANQGVAGISDRGMLPSDNPKNHPNHPNNPNVVKQPNSGENA